MSKENTAPTTALWSELFHAALYKPTQGRITRQVSGFAFAIIACLGAWRLYELNQIKDPYRFPVALAIAAIGSWIAYRLVNWPQFADFLIGVEAEMNKVSWPSWTELKRSSIVVIVLLAGLTVILYGFDILWYYLLHFIGVIMV